MAKNATPMLEQLAKTLEEDTEQREELIKKIKVNPTVPSMLG